MLQAVINFRRSMPPFRVALRKGKRAFQVPKTALNHHIVSYSFSSTQRPPPQNIKTQRIELKRLSAELSLPLDDQYSKWANDEKIIGVDKTNIIGEVIDRKEKQILLMSMKRSGKSTILKMLKFFFELNYQKQKKYFRRRRVLKNYMPAVIQKQFVKMTQPNLDAFKNKKIQKETKWETEYKYYQNAHPVIFMDWKGSSSLTYLGVKVWIAKKILNCYRQVGFLETEVSGLKEYRKKLQIVAFSDDQKQIEKVSIDSTLWFLTCALGQYFGYRVIILIDEYDYIFNNFLFAEIEEKDKVKKKILAGERVKVTRCIKSLLLQALKGNKYLLKGILTGVYNSLPIHGFSGLNNMQVYNMTKNYGFRSAFGFTKTEIIEQLILRMFDSKYNSESVKRLIQKMQDSDNGYSIPCLTQQEGQTKKAYLNIFNSYSVIRYLRDCLQKQEIIEKKDYFWPKVTGSSTKVLKLLFQRSFFPDLKTKLLSTQINSQSRDKDKCAVVPFSPNINISDFDSSREEEIEKKIVYLLFHIGLITGQINGENELHARIPNLEMKSAFDTVFYQWISSFVDECEVDYEDLSTFPLLLLKACQKYIDEESRSLNQSMVQLLQYGLQCRSKVEHYKYTVKRNVIDGGRYDTLLLPKIFKKYTYNQDQEEGKSIAQKKDGIQQKSIILSEEKITTQKDFNVAYLKALKQLLQKNYLGCLDQNAQNVDNQAGIVLRAVVIVHNSAKNKISVFTSKENAVFSFEQVLKLCLHCKKQEIKAELARKDLSLEDFTKVVRDGSGKTDANFEGKMWHEKQVNLDMKKDDE